MKIIFRIICVVGLVPLLNGCIFPVMWSNPGYEINLKSSKVMNDYVILVKQLLEWEGYGYLAKSERCFQYSKVIVNEEEINHPDVGVLVCFDKAKEYEEVKRFNVLIANFWQGQEPIFKQEIDRMGDILYEKLVELIGKENITIERRATGPPF